MYATEVYTYQVTLCQKSIHSGTDTFHGQSQIKTSNACRNGDVE